MSASPPSPAPPSQRDTGLILAALLICCYVCVLCSLHDTCIRHIMILTLFSRVQCRVSRRRCKHHWGRERPIRSLHHVLIHCAQTPSPCPPLCLGVSGITLAGLGGETSTDEELMSPLGPVLPYHPEDEELLLSVMISRQVLTFVSCPLSILALLWLPIYPSCLSKSDHFLPIVSSI